MIYAVHLALPSKFGVDYGIKNETTRYHQMYVQRVAPCSDGEVPIDSMGYPDRHWLISSPRERIEVWAARQTRVIYVSQVSEKSPPISIESEEHRVLESLRIREGVSSCRSTRGVLEEPCWLPEPESRPISICSRYRSFSLGYSVVWPVCWGRDTRVARALERPGGAGWSSMSWVWVNMAGKKNITPRLCRGPVLTGVSGGV
jgi:hypothetical protein